MAKSKSKVKNEVARKEINISFRLLRVDIESFIMNPIPEGLDIDLQKLNYNVSFKSKIVEEKDEYIVAVHVTIVFNNLNIGAITTHTVFEIIDLSKVADEVVSNSDFDETILSVWLTIAYSTSRGILIEKTADSKIGSLLMPLIDPIQLIKSQREIEGLKKKV